MLQVSSWEAVGAYSLDSLGAHHPWRPGGEDPEGFVQGIDTSRGRKKEIGGMEGLHMPRVGVEPGRSLLYAVASVSSGTLFI